MFLLLIESLSLSKALSVWIFSILIFLMLNWDRYRLVARDLVMIGKFWTSFVHSADRTWQSMQSVVIYAYDRWVEMWQNFDDFRDFVTLALVSCCVNGQAKVVMPSTRLSLNVKKDSVRRRISAKGSSSKTHRVKNPQRGTVTQRRGKNSDVAPCNRPIRMTNDYDTKWRPAELAALASLWKRCRPGNVKHCCFKPFTITISCLQFNAHTKKIKER